MIFFSPMRLNEEGFSERSVSQEFKIQLSTMYAAESSGMTAPSFKSPKCGLGEAAI